MSGTAGRRVVPKPYASMHREHCEANWSAVWSENIKGRITNSHKNADKALLKAESKCVGVTVLINSANQQQRSQYTGAILDSVA